MPTQVAQQGEDGVPSREEDEDGPGRLQTPEVGQQGRNQLKGNVPLRHLGYGVLGSQGVGLLAKVQVLLWKRG